MRFDVALVIFMRRYLITLAALVAALVVSASAHSLWVEAKDTAEVGDLQEAYTFFGHATSSTGIYVPLMDSTYLVTPNGEKLDLNMQTENWLPGYGWMEYLVADTVLYWPGDYVLASQRAPGVFDMAWHGGESSPMLYCDSAKAIIHCGEGEKVHNWDADFPLEITFEEAPYEVESGDNFTVTITYNGEPVSAECYASYWTWDAHSGPDVQRGTGDENGTFTVNLNNGGLWVIGAEYDEETPGEWTATYDSGDHFKTGDQVPYNALHCRSTLSLWVR